MERDETFEELSPVKLERAYLEKVREKFEELDIGSGTRVSLENVFVTFNSHKETIVEKTRQDEKSEKEGTQPSKFGGMASPRKKPYGKDREPAREQVEVCTERSKPMPILEMLNRMDRVILVGLPGHDKLLILHLLSLFTSKIQFECGRRSSIYPL